MSDKNNQTAVSQSPMTLCSAVRELMVAVEFMRSICEHAEGVDDVNDQMLSRAMSVGIRINARYAHLLDDYQRDTFWADVSAISDVLDLPNAKVRRAAENSEQPQNHNPQ